MESKIARIPTIINDTYFLENSPIGRNYDCTDIRPYYHIAEELWIVPIIGVDLYNELLSQVVKNEVTELNATLLIRIYPLLSFAVTYEALPFIGYHLSQIGISRGHSENSEPVSVKDMNYISQTLRGTIESMKKCLKEFLEQNKELYPLYRGEEDCTCEAKETKIDPFIYNFYFNGGGMGKYDWQRYMYEQLRQTKKPNPYSQTYTTRRQCIELN